MSKIRNLFKKLSLKKKKSQESDEVEFDQLDQEELDEEFDEDIGDETIIFEDGFEGEELLPHETSGPGEQPSEADLSFPEIPTDDETEQTATIQANEDLLSEDATAQFEFGETHTDNEVIIDQDIEFSQTPDEEPNFDDTTDFNLDDIDAEGDADDVDPFLEMDDSEVSDPMAEEEEVVVAQDEGTQEFNEPAMKALEDDEEQEEDFTGTSEAIDLDRTEITMSDRIYHFKTRAMDRIRNFNKKDLNQAFKKPSSPTSIDLTQKIDLNKLKSKALSINWVDLPNQFFKKTQFPKYHRIFQISTITIAVYGIANIGGNIISGSKNYNAVGKKNVISVSEENPFTRADLDKIKTANLFKTEAIKKKESKVAQKPKNTEKVCTKATQRSNLGVKLISAIVLQDSVKSIASVQMRSSSKLEHFREGDTLMNKARIDRISSSNLIIKNLRTDECEKIEATVKKGFKPRKKISVLSPRRSKQFKKQRKQVAGIKSEGNDFTIDKAFLQKKLTDINSLLQDAKGIPIRNPDGTLSFKIVEIQPDSVYSNLNIQNGDIITQINGEPIKELNEVTSLFGKISTLTKLNLTIKRDGEDINQNYNIK